MAKNKVTREARREIRAFVKKQYMIINSVLKPRPKYFPQFLWRYLAGKFIDIPKLRRYFDEGIKSDRR